MALVHMWSSAEGLETVHVNWGKKGPCFGSSGSCLCVQLVRLKQAWHFGLMRLQVRGFVARPKTLEPQSQGLSHSVPKLRPRTLRGLVQTVNARIARTLQVETESPFMALSPKPSPFNPKP